MRRPRHVLTATLAAAVLLMTAAACRSDDNPAVAPTTPTTPTTTAAQTAGTSPTSVLTTTTTSVAATSGTLTLSLTDVRLVNSEESDNALRILFASTALDVAVTLGSGVPSPNRVILVCATVELERRVPGAPCVTPAAGEAVRVPYGSAYKGVEIVQVGVAGSGAAANSTALSEITLTFAGTSRDIRIRLPALRQGESGGRPSFRLSPVGPGTYRASATWTSPGEAELALTSGASTTTRAQGASGIQITGNLSPPAEAAVQFRNTGSTVLIGPTLSILFP